jgi:hypothetical protein
MAKIVAIVITLLLFLITQKSVSKNWAYLVREKSALTKQDAWIVVLMAQWQ